MLEKMNCPFIVKLYYAFHDKEQIYFVTEFMQGGELFFQLHKNSQLMSQERTVVFYSSEILLAIEYIHKQNYIYRDLKPENILINLNKKKNYFVINGTKKKKLVIKLNLKRKN